MNETYEELLSAKNLDALSNDKAIEHIGFLVDASEDALKEEGLKKAILLAHKLLERKLESPQKSLLYYYISNAWAVIQRMSTQNNDSIWNWEQSDLEEQIINLRLALNEKGFSKLIKERRCQIYTNLGNHYSHIGRFVEAIDYWERSLKSIPNYAMGAGNIGLGYYYYANYLYDNGHKLIFLKHAHKNLKNISKSEVEREAFKCFSSVSKNIETGIVDFLDHECDLESFSLGLTDEEITYRKWCLNNRLFINPLNDLGAYPIAARDVLTTPAIITGISEGPIYQGMFNQIKQEYTSARYLFF